MAARDSLAPAGLLWLCLAPAALLRLHQPQPVLVVQPGEQVNIDCEVSKDMETKSKVFWYWRVGGKEPKLVLDCTAKSKLGHFCEVKRHNITLTITRVDRHNTGIYLCAYTRGPFLDFGSSTTLVVGDSWSAGSRVMVLVPHGAPQDPPGLVCAVGNVTGPVLVSRPGGPGKVLGLGNDTRLLISPLGTAGGSGVLCEVRFNASGSPIHRSLELFRDVGCSMITPLISVLAAAGVLLLLSICLSIRCLLRTRPMGPQPATTEPPASQEAEGELNYAQLIFTAPARPRP